MSCIIKWIPPNLQDLELYKELDYLYCSLNFDDDYLQSLLTKFPLSFTTRTGGEEQINLDWYSSLSWNDINFGDWNTSSVDFGSSLNPSETLKFFKEIDLLKIMRGIDISEDGFNAWKNIIEPYYGTSEIQRYLLKISPYKGKYFEWYEYEYPIFTYGFVFDSLPNNYQTQLDSFIKLSRIYKNIESDFYSIQDDKLYCSLISDEKPLDECFLDSPNGKLFDGVLLLFTNIFKDETEQFETLDYKFLTSIKTELLFTWFDSNSLYDSYILDETNDKYLWKQMTVYQPFRFVQMNPGYLVSPLSNGWEGFWEPYQTWERIEFDKLIERQYTPEVIDWDENYTWEENILFKGKISDFDSLNKTKTTNNILLEEFSLNSFYTPRVIKFHKIEKIY